MNILTFGRQLFRFFLCEVDEQPFNLPNQTPTIYVFDSEPSREAGQAGTDAIATISAWTEQDVPPYARVYTVDAIADPEPNSITWCRTYWEAINFRYASDEQIQTVIRSFEVRRPTVTDDQVIVSKDDVRVLFPNIGSYISDSDLDMLLPVANDQVRKVLKRRGKDWYQFRNQSELKYAVIYKTISLQGLGSVKDPGDRHAYRFEQFDKWYQDEMSSINLPYDSDNDGHAETTETPNSSTQITYR